jgi:ribosomal protein S18 acetylase RimI-like enzyme
MIAIRPVGPPDLPLLDTALRTLSSDLGDTHRADAAVLERAAFGSNPAFRAMIALDDAALRGAVVFSPAFSTVLGGAGLYVSDLWVDRDARGQGLGARLLAAASFWAQELWQARYLRLAVYDTTPEARAFYESLGFEDAGGQTVLLLAGGGFDRLKGRT